MEIRAKHVHVGDKVYPPIPGAENGLVVTRITIGPDEIVILDFGDEVVQFHPDFMMEVETCKCQRH